MNHLLDERKSKFINWLVSNDLYITLAMFAKCQVVVDAQCPSLAAVSVRLPPVISLHPWLIENGSDYEIACILMHELSHLPQMVYVKSLWAQVDYPESCDTEDKQRAATTAVLNVAMDIALHEQLKPLLPNLQHTLGGLIKRFLKSEEPEETFGAFVTSEMEPGKDAAYYVSKLLRDNPPTFVSVDVHDFGEGEVPMEGFMDDASAEGRALANKAGRRVGDEAIHLQRDPLFDRVRSAIQRIRVSVNRIAEGRSVVRYNWNRLNRHWIGLPGKMVTKELAAGVFMVADTSGSMCTPSVLNQLIPAMEFLKTRALIAGAYACDTQLTPFGKTVKGGGGTEMNSSHARQLRALHKLPENAKIDIVYVTDGYVDLQELEADPTVKLHLVVI